MQLREHFSRNCCPSGAAFRKLIRTFEQTGSDTDIKSTEQFRRVGSSENENILKRKDCQDPTPGDSIRHGLQKFKNQLKEELLLANHSSCDKRSAFPTEWLSNFGALKVHAIHIP